MSVLLNCMRCVHMHILIVVNILIPPFFFPFDF
jgi:hypothetical protein